MMVIKAYVQRSGEEKMYRTIAGVLIISVLATLCIAAAPAYIDVLDAPALKSSLAEKSLLNGVTLAGNRLVCVGWRGHIVYSDDHGRTWLQAKVPVSSDLVAVYFPSAQKGWAVGHDGIVLHSGDGGITWQKQLDGRAAAQIMLSYYTRYPPRSLPGGSEATARMMDDIKRFVQEGADKPFLDVWFENETTGFIVGTFNLIFRTTDGGKSWDPWYDRTENPNGMHFYGIRPVGRDLFIVGEQGLVLKLDPQTGRFRQMKTPYQGSFFGITGNSGSLIAFGLRGNVFRSCDGGVNWQKIETGIMAGLTGATVTEEGQIVLVSQGGHILKSTDGGASFTLVKVEQLIPATAVCALNKETLAITGLGGLQMQTIKQNVKENVK
jgi:photosystem II stability/assembly factor-like uncharacterized protein